MSPEPSPAGALALRAPDELRAVVDKAIATAVDQRWASRLAARDTTLWTTDEHVAETITNRLGWLGVPRAMADEASELQAFVFGVREVGYTDVVVCGMGGSSLAPEVLAAVFPASDGALRVRVLDSTDPAAVRATETASDPASTLRIIATKSGTTTETLAFLAYFWETEHHRVGRFHGNRAGDGFIAVTDQPALEAIPHSDLFRGTFLNPPNVGGRYSALTYVGLVPAALLGLDVAALLQEGAEMLERCATDSADNPGVSLGAALGALALVGRDKLTLLIEPDLAPLGSWLEQLIAESTGKSGTGIVPVDGEPLGGPEVYGPDRVFVRLGRPGHTAAFDAQLDALVAAGHPVIDVPLVDGTWVGAEFSRWEVATAIAGAVLGVDPFDEPNVTESKHNTRVALDQHAHHGSFPESTAAAASGALRLFADTNLAEELSVAASPPAAVDVLRQHLARIIETGYHAITAYIAPTPERTAALRRIQASLRDRTRHATTLGYGPRFLHSTGQLHKGGTPSGCFLQLVAGHPEDLPIPGHKESFGVLIDAQALGDLASLESHGLPVLRVHLSDDPDAGLAQLETLLATALG